MKDGTQIIYFPPHVEFGDELHPDIEVGFVFGNNPLSVYPLYDTSYNICVPFSERRLPYPQ